MQLCSIKPSTVGRIMKITIFSIRKTRGLGDYAAYQSSPSSGTSPQPPSAGATILRTSPRVVPSSPSPVSPGGTLRQPSEFRQAAAPKTWSPVTPPATSPLPYQQPIQHQYNRAAPQSQHQQPQQPWQVNAWRKKKQKKEISLLENPRYDNWKYLPKNFAFLVNWRVVNWRTFLRMQEWTSVRSKKNIDCSYVSNNLFFVFLSAKLIRTVETIDTESETEPIDSGLSSARFRASTVPHNSQAWAANIAGDNRYTASKMTKS